LKERARQRAFFDSAFFLHYIVIPTGARDLLFVGSVDGAEESRSLASLRMTTPEAE
jgi:hypothetical protein